MGDAEVTASNWRLVELGRVTLFAKGPFEGRLAVIIQIIDHKRVLVEGPSSDPKKAVPRHASPLSHLSLSAIVIPDFPIGAGSAVTKKRWEAAEVESTWTNSAFAKNKAKMQRRKELSDFERFKVMVLRKQARFEIKKSLASSRASAKA